MIATIARIRKLIAAGVGLIAQLIAAGILTGDAEMIALGVIAFVTAVGVYRVPNAPAPPPGPLD